VEVVAWTRRGHRQSGGNVVAPIRLRTTGGLTGAAVLAAAALATGGTAVASTGTSGLAAARAVSVWAAGAGLASGLVQGAGSAGATPAVQHRQGSTVAPARDFGSCR
jgi:hypothetical protein